MKKFVAMIVSVFAALTPLPSQAGVVVVVNSSVEVDVSKADVAALFLGKKKSISGISLVPIDQEDGSAPRDKFYQKVVNKTPAQLNAYWARIIFTGKGQPPKAAFDDTEVIEMLEKDSAMIAYIDSASVTAAVKVLLTVD